LAVGLALALSSAAPAHAQAPSAEGQAEARRSAAKEKFDQGVTAYKEQRYEDAVKLFMEADAMSPSSALSFNVARAFEKLEDISGALRWYRDFLRRSPEASNAAEVRAKVAELAAALSRRGVQQVSVLSEPPGATVLVDDQNVGVTPVTRDLTPGKHRLVLRLSGYADKSTELRLEPLVPQDVSLELSQPSPDRPADGAAPRADQPPTAPGTRFGVVPYVVMGAGAAGLLGALGFEISRRSADSDAEQAPQNQFQGHYDTMESRQTTARVLAGLGGALLVTGGVLFFVDRRREPGPAALTTTAAPQVAVGCLDSGCGLFARGSFR
jgi:tetratricopeptide (TPR) repeat protein